MVLTVAGTVALAAPPTATAATPAQETGGVCRTHTLTRYGYRTSCLVGSFYDRVQVGSIDATFAIRGDRAVVYASPNHGWVRVSTGRADYVKWVDATSGGLQGVCVETRAGHLYYSSYHRHRGWQTFTAGCAAG